MFHPRLLVVLFDRYFHCEVILKSIILLFTPHVYHYIQIREWLYSFQRLCYAVISTDVESMLCEGEDEYKHIDSCRDPSIVSSLIIEFVDIIHTVMFMFPSCLIDRQILYEGRTTYFQEKTHKAL